MISILTTETSQVSQARREATAIAERLGFSEVEKGRVALVATELATNILKHGGGGEMLVGTFEDRGGGGLEILALDRGPGFADLRGCWADGYSSTGTPGNGLGAVTRLSHTMDVVSWPKQGAAILARLERGTPPATPKKTQPYWGAVSVAKPGEDVCGDGWMVQESDDARSVMVADGLGHGPDAAKASTRAIHTFLESRNRPFPGALEDIHRDLRSTRGAAVSLARIDHAGQRVNFAGVGNVAGLVAQHGAATRHMISLPGTAGHNARKIQAFDYPLREGLVILYSDGLATSWTLGAYPGLAYAHPTLIAGVLFRDFWRRRDDVTIVVAKSGANTGAPS